MIDHIEQKINECKIELNLLNEKETLGEIAELKKRYFNIRLKAFEELMEIAIKEYQVQPPTKNIVTDGLLMHFNGNDVMKLDVNKLPLGIDALDELSKIANKEMIEHKLPLGADIIDGDFHWPSVKKMLDDD